MASDAPSPPVPPAPTDAGAPAADAPPAPDAQSPAGLEAQALRAFPADHHRPFGGDTFGVQAERFARFFGTPTFILGQSAVVVLWIVLNALVITSAIAWDKYPFIALNLAFSLQAAYAAPLILLAQTRQADRDKARDAISQAHRDAEARHAAAYEQRQAQVLIDDRTLAEQHTRMLQQNTDLTRQVAQLTEELRNAVYARGAPAQPPGTHTPQSPGTHTPQSPGG